MKKLLILAGAGVHCKVVEAAQEMGIYTVVTDYLQDSPAKCLADERLDFDIYDIEELVDYGKENGINGVLGFCVDPTQVPAQQIAERLKTNVFGNSEQVFKLTNKPAFKKLCRETGVDTIPEYTQRDMEEGKIQYPVLVKPVDSRGSRGIKVCYDQEELRAAIPLAQNESSDGNIIIEKYMVGHQDLTISYLIKNGKPVLVSIGDRYSGREEDNLNRQLVCTIQPSRYAQMYMENVDERVKNMIRHLGIQNGPVFMQGFVDGDTVRMYDPGIRFPGNEYERIFEKATGMNLVKSVISYVVGGEIDDYNGRLEGSYNLNGLCAMQYMINVGPGEIATFEGLDEIKKLPYVVDVQQRHFVGEKIEPTGDIRHRAGEISILTERESEKMENAIRTIQSMLKVLDTEGKNMLISPFEVKMIGNYFPES